MDFHDVVFLPSRASFPTTFYLKIVVEVKTLRLPHLKTVVVGK